MFTMKIIFLFFIKGFDLNSCSGGYFSQMWTTAY